MSNTLIIALAVVILVFAGVWLFGQPGSRGAESGGKYTDPSALAKLLEEKTEPYVLVDVRTPEEYASEHIPGSILIPYDTIASRSPVKEKDALVILYCRSGNRSGIAKRTLLSLGFSNVEDFGGIGRWKGALAKGDKP
jgi:rhodanese-related sulfurtransferase